jgi:hypothetical protein
MRQLCLNRGSFSHASTGKSAITAGRGDGVGHSPLPPGTDWRGLERARLWAGETRSEPTGLASSAVKRAAPKPPAEDGRERGAGEAAAKAARSDEGAVAGAVSCAAAAEAVAAQAVGPAPRVINEKERTGGAGAMRRCGAARAARAACAIPLSKKYSKRSKE